MTTTDTISASLLLQITGKETLGTDDHPGGSSTNDRTLAHNAFNASATFSATSTPTGQRIVEIEITLGAGTTTIDLTSAPKSAGRTEDLTGFKAVAGLLTAPRTNSGDVTVAPGASNPYPLFGTGNSVAVPAGRTMAFGDTEQANLAAVSSSAKTIDVSGTSGDILRLMLVMGESA